MLMVDEGNMGLLGCYILPMRPLHRIHPLLTKRLRIKVREKGHNYAVKLLRAELNISCGWSTSRCAISPTALPLMDVDELKDLCLLSFLSRSHYQSSLSKSHSFLQRRMALR